MPDTKIQLPLGVSGWNLYTRLRNEDGLIWNSTTSAFVAYVLADIAHYDLATDETPAGSGDYAATMPAGAAAGNYSWAQYRRMGGAPAAGDPLAGTGGGSWTGTEFATVADAIADIADLQFDVSDVFPVALVEVQDPAPTIGRVVVKMEDDSDVPISFVWRGKKANFAANSPNLPYGSFPITTMTRLTEKTAELRFTPSLPGLPTDGELIKVL
jgi:hypothetical protein